MRVATFTLGLGLLATSVPAADRILYATAASQDRVDGFCLRPNGDLDPVPSVRQATRGRQPRRLLVVGDVLYVAEVDRVEAFRINPRGGLSRIARTKATRGVRPLDIAANSDSRMLYVPHRFQDRVVGHPIDADGIVSEDFTTCIQGDLGASFQNLIVNGPRLYVTSNGGIGRIEVFGVAEDGVLFGKDGERLDAEACRDTGRLSDRPPTTEPLSARRRVRNPKAFVLNGDVIYLEERGTRRISSFRLDADGDFADPVEGEKRTTWQPRESRTRAVAHYQGLVLHGSTLLASQFFRGRIDTYRLRSDGTLPRGPARLSRADLRLTPVRMVAEGNRLYVAAGEHDRVVAYRLRAETGALAHRTPISSTGEQKGSFPNDVAVAMLSGNCR